MVWNIPPHSKGQWARIGLKPTPEDHSLVKAWCLMGIGVRVICEKLGEHYKLAKPLSRYCLYYHFRQDIVVRKKRKTKNIPSKAIKSIESEMRKMMDTVKSRVVKEPCGEDEE